MNNKVLEDHGCNILNMKSFLMKYRNWMYFCISKAFCGQQSLHANEATTELS